MPGVSKVFPMKMKTIHFKDSPKKVKYFNSPKVSNFIKLENKLLNTDSEELINTNGNPLFNT